MEIHISNPIVPKLLKVLAALNFMTVKDTTKNGFAAVLKEVMFESYISPCTWSDYERSWVGKSKTLFKIKSSELLSMPIFELAF